MFSSATSEILSAASKIKRQEESQNELEGQSRSPVSNQCRFRLSARSLSSFHLLSFVTSSYLSLHFNFLVDLVHQTRLLRWQESFVQINNPPPMSMSLFCSPLPSNYDQFFSVVLRMVKHATATATLGHKLFH
jgi:hypothetical protein